MTAFERSVLSFKYIRNGYPERPHLQPCAYKDNKSTYLAIRDWGKKGKLNDLQQRLLLAPSRAPEELYDLKTDPWELKNLADEPKHAKTLLKMRKTLDQWIKQTGDQGQKSRIDEDVRQRHENLHGRTGKPGPAGTV